MLPANLPASTRVTYDAESKQLLIERQLPTLANLPADEAFRYVKKTDTIIPVARKGATLRAMYANILAQIALRSLRVALAADTAEAVSVFAFNGFVLAIDPRTGKPVSPTLISLSADRQSLNDISFEKVESSAACVASRPWYQETRTNSSQYALWSSSIWLTAASSRKPTY